MTNIPSAYTAAGASLLLTGATQPTRYVGATASGAPSSGTFAVGDFVVDQTGSMWVCIAAGSPGTWVNASSSGAMYLPSDSGLLAANYDPLLSATSVVLVAGTMYLMKVPVRNPFTWTNIVFNINTVGAGTSAGCLAGLYTPAGALLSSTADLGATFTGSSGAKSAALSAAQSLTPATEAFVWAAFLCNLQTTQVKLSSIAANVGNGNLAVSVFRYCVNSPAATTVAAGSNGGEISQIASWSSPSAGILDVASTAGYPSSGSIAVAASGSTLALVTYTGTAGGNQFTGCAYVSGSATGTVATGGAVTMASLPASITPSSNVGAGAFAFWVGGS